MQNPQNDDELTALIDLHQAGDLVAACSGYERILRSRPNDCRVLYLYSMALHQQGDHSGALEQVERALELDERDVRCLNHRGEVLAALGEIERAVQSFKAALVRAPSEPASYNNLAVLHYQAGDLAGAIDYLVRGMEVAPHDCGLAVNSARILMHNGQREEARVVLENHLRNRPGDAEVRQALDELNNQAALPETPGTAPGEYASGGPDQNNAAGEGREVLPELGEPRLSLVLPIEGDTDTVKAQLDAIYACAGGLQVFEVILVSDSLQPKLHAWLQAQAVARSNLQVVTVTQGTGFFEACNSGARQAQGNLLIFMRGQLHPVPGCLDDLVADALSASDVGVVGARVLIADGSGKTELLRVRHCGVVFDERKYPKNLYEFCLAAQPFVSRQRNVQAVGADCMLVRGDLYKAVGGFSDNCGVYADLDFCFKVRERGVRVVMCADAVLVTTQEHSEKTVSVPRSDRDDKGDYASFLDRWGGAIEADELRCYAADGLRLPDKGDARLAMVTPLSPQKTGVAHYVQELLPYLSAHARVDLFVDDYLPCEEAVLAKHKIYRICDLEKVSHLESYDQRVYQIGNNHFHASIYQAAMRMPGVVVLHEYDCKGCSSERTNRELLSKLLGSAKGLIVHNEHACRLLQPEFPRLPITVVPHIFARDSLTRGLDRSTARSSLSLPDSAFVVVSLGLIQPHKRNHVTVEAFARFAAQQPNALLVLAGEAPDPRYARHLSALAARLGVQGKVRMTGWVSDAEFFAYLSAADVTVNLRYPSRGEESGSLTRILGCGRPALVSDYAQFSEIPDDCVIKIGFEHEVTSIADALAHLEREPGLRETLSANASRLLSERNAGERVGRLYAESATQKPQAGAESNEPDPRGRCASVLWEGPVWSLTHPARDLILALDTAGVGVKVVASDVPLVMRSPISARSRQRLAELSEGTLADRYVYVHSGKSEDYRRDANATACIVVVHEVTSVDFAELDADEFWVPSHFMREKLCRGAVPQERVRVVPYGVSGLLYGTAVYESFLRPQRLLLCPTDFSRDTGWEDVLLAFLEEFGGRKDVGLRLKLIGDAIDSSDIEKACVEGLRSFRLAHPKIPVERFANVSYERSSVAEDDMPAYYAEASAVVSPNINAPFGRSLLEALALGLPVITTQAGGQTEFISTQNCLIVPTKGARNVMDLRSLRQLMRKVFDGDPGISRLGIVGRSQVLQNWTWSASASLAARAVLERLGQNAPANDCICSSAARRSTELHTASQCGGAIRTTGGEAAVMPAADPVRFNTSETADLGFGFNVISYVSGNLGIGVTARNVVQMLLERGFPVAVLDMDPGLGRKGHDKRFDQYVVSTAAELPYAINLLILPPAELTALTAGNPAFFRDESRMNVGFSMWELTVLPAPWKTALESLDVLVAESEFIRYCFQFNLSNVLTLATEHPVYMPEDIRADRRRFDLPADGILFISSFEPFSDPSRKNPFAAIESFLDGVGADERAHLVLKLNNAENGGQDHPVMKRLREYTQQNPRIHLLTGTLDYADVLRLYASCDVYVSLHRAEGLGLGMLEAMALGKPVIATAWSGNMSFMDHTNSCLVGYRLIPVDGSIPAYARENVGPDAVWAEPDRCAASAWMRRLCEDPELRNAIGNRAREAIQEYHRRAREGRFVDEIRAIWAQQKVSEAFTRTGEKVITGATVAPASETAAQPPVAPVARPAPESAPDGHPEPLLVTNTPKCEQDVYQQWLERHSLTISDRNLLRERATARTKQPVFHVFVRASLADRDALADTLDTIDAQIHTDWVVSVLADFPPPDRSVENLVRLNWLVIDQSDGEIAPFVNREVDRVEADWIILLRAGDCAAPQALARCADYIDLHPEWRQIYTDEDRLDSTGTRIDPRLKPDFNLDLLRSTDYFGQLRVTHRDTWKEAGGLRDLLGAEHYDLSLRILDEFGEAAIGHIAEVLCSRRIDVDQNHELGDPAEQQGAALREHLRRNALSGAVLPGTLPGTFMIDYQWDCLPLVSVVIPTRDRKDLLSACVGSLLEKTPYPQIEVLIVDNDSRDASTLAYLDGLTCMDSRVRVLRFPGEFNFSAMNNLAAAEARGDFLLLLNNDTVIVQQNWLERMVNLGMRPDVGIVGARLVYPDQTLQHAGIVGGMGRLGIGEHIHIGQPMQAPGYMGRAQLVQNFSAVTAACMLIKKELYLDVGGMDQVRLKVLFNDIDLCLKVVDRGLKVVWTPFATVLHHGSLSVKKNAEPSAIARAVRELNTMEERWLATLAKDPAHNRHLSLRSRIPRIETELDARWDPEFHDRPRLIGAGAGSFGSWQYRVVQPVRAMEARELAHAMLLPFEDSRIELPTAAEIERLEPDTLLMHNTLSDAQLKRIGDYKRSTKSFVVLGQDDLMFELPRKNPFSRQVLKDMRKRLRRCLALCDRLVVTTEPLAEVLGNMAEDIRVVPNYLDNAVWSGLRSRRRRGERPRVGWAGAMQHGGDLELLESVVRETADEVDWVFFGMCPESIVSCVREVHKPVRFEQYPTRLAALDLDLAVAPLEHNRFNEAKSNLRLLEYGVLGWPVVCTNIHPYRDAPVTRIANNARTWIKTIRDRVHDLDALAAEGDQLRHWVLENWMLDEHLEEWRDALNPVSVRKVAECASSGTS